MVKWAQFRTVRFVVLAVLILYAGAACSNMFSQVDGGTGDVVFEFQANMLFNETGSTGVPYLIPTADRIEATLSRVGGTAATDITVEQALVRTADGTGVASTIEFPSVPTNVEHTISVRIFSSSNPGVTLHSGAKTVSPITRAERIEEVDVRLNAGIVQTDQIEVFDLKQFFPEIGEFALYQLDTDLRPAESHILFVEGDPDLQGIRLQLLSSGFRGTSIDFEDEGAGLQASLPASLQPYYLAVYRETDAPIGIVELEFSLSSFAPPGVAGFVSPTSNTTPSITVTGPPGVTFRYSVTGATEVPEEEVPDTGDTGEETIVLPPLNEGVHIITVYYEDIFGNFSSETTVEIVTDYTPPPPPSGVFSSDLVGSPPDQFTFVDTPTFTWVGSGEPGATWEYSFDSGTTWNLVPETSVTLGPLPPGVHGFIVREIDLAGNISGPTPLTQFEYVLTSESIITINNPGIPEFSMDTGGFTLNVTANDVQVITVSSAEIITNYFWFINGELNAMGEDEDEFEIAAADVTVPASDLVLGLNTLTLVVEIGGLPYSEDFFFTIVEE
ncbi:MAG: hypothetical protein EA383_02390 [Spirochaetaceae bacterium]|nr:MAG: hypothetical protein EA383_02390 [Spirochaetaceae bacterium]